MIDGLVLDIPRFTEALCAQSDPEIFFPEKGGSTRAAKDVCRRCEGRDECLEWALTRHERFGIWGAASERERRRLALDRGIAIEGDPLDDEIDLQRLADITELIDAGFAPAAIAEALGIPTHTVHNDLRALRGLADTA